MSIDYFSSNCGTVSRSATVYLVAHQCILASVSKVLGCPCSKYSGSQQTALVISILLALYTVQWTIL